VEAGHDFAAGSVVYEIEIMLSSDSGRAKHTDVRDQGAWLIYPLARGLQSMVDLEGAAFGAIHYLGEGPVPGRKVITSRPVGPPIGPFTEDEMSVTAATLHGVIRRLSEMLAVLLPEASDEQVAQFDSRHEPMMDVIAWALDQKSLDEFEDQQLAQALRWPY
jgi:hypothetical protein